MLVRMGRALAILLFVAGPALAADRYPAFTDYVVDTANILDANSVARIQTIASRLNDAGIAQIAVATVPDLGDKTKEEYAVGLFEAWKLGHGKPRADGLLILMVPGAPGHRKIKAEVGYGLEGILPDGKVTALIDQYAVPSMKRDAYGPAAADLVQAYARVIEANAGAGGELAPTAGARRAAGNQSPIAGVGGLAFAGWIALLVGLVVNGLAFASIRAHRCPRDGSWMSIDEEVIDEPTYWSSGLARVVEACTNPRCGYRRQYDKELPRKQRTVYIGGGGFGGGGGGGGWGGGGGGDGFSGGGGGDSGGGGGGREV